MANRRERFLGSDGRGLNHNAYFTTEALRFTEVFRFKLFPPASSACPEVLEGRLRGDVSETLLRERHKLSNIAIRRERTFLDSTSSHSVFISFRTFVLRKSLPADASKLRI